MHSQSQTYTQHTPAEPVKICHSGRRKTKDSRGDSMSEWGTDRLLKRDRRKTKGF